MKDYTQPSRSTIVQTIGYEKTDLSAYIARLKVAGVSILVDVRERPISRKKGFSKSALAAAVHEVGIDYLHVHALGDPKSGRDAAKSGEFDLFVEIFSRHMVTEQATTALSDLAEMVLGKNICLTCFERDHTTCHRSIVAARLAELTGGVVHHISV